MQYLLPKYNLIGSVKSFEQSVFHLGPDLLPLEAERNCKVEFDRAGQIISMLIFDHLGKVIAERNFIYDSEGKFRLEELIENKFRTLGLLVYERTDYISKHTATFKPPPPPPTTKNGYTKIKPFDFLSPMKRVRYINGVEVVIPPPPPSSFTSDYDTQCKKNLKLNELNLMESQGYTFDNSSNQLTTYRISNGILEIRKIEKFNKDNNVVEVITYPLGKLINEQETDDLLTNYQETDKHVHKWIFEYDNSNNIRTVSCYDKDELKQVIDYKFEFDEKGNWIKCIKEDVLKKYSPWLVFGEEVTRTIVYNQNNY